MADQLSPDARRSLRGVLNDKWSDLSERRAQTSRLTTTEIALRPEIRLLLGVDQNGLPHFLVELDRHVRNRVVLQTRGVTLEIRSLLMNDQPHEFVDLHCRATELTGAFFGLLTEICAALAVEVERPLARITRLVKEWRDLLGSADSVWSRSQNAGLMAELIVLLRLLERHPSAAPAWTGPTGAAQDFRSPGRALEVKATLGGEGRLATIHGWDQLEPPTGGALHLAWFRLEEDSSGQTVRELISAVVKACDDPAMVEGLIRGLAVPSGPHDEVDHRRLAVREEQWFRVSDSFPRITPATFSIGSVPGGVVDLIYRIDLDTVPSSCVEDNYGRILDELASAW